jgi:F0F1-type ATP synthase assembly protein I
VERSQGREFTQQLNQTSGSYELVLAPAVLVLLGYLADGWLGTRPVLTWIAVFFAVVGAAIKVVLMVRNYGDEMDELDRQGPWSRRPPARAAVEAEKTDAGQAEGERP